MTTYRQQLRDPRWQRRRLQIFERDNWQCQQCGATEEELQVHHKVYTPGAAPWEVPTRALVTLCKGCHRRKRTPHKRKRRQQRG